MRNKDKGKKRTPPNNLNELSVVYVHNKPELKNLNELVFPFEAAKSVDSHDKEKIMKNLSH